MGKEQDESKSKKHRNSEGERESKRDDKDCKSKKRKRDVPHKSSKNRSKDDKPREKDTVKSHKHGVSSKSKIEEISSADYFSKNNEFSTWLKEVKKIFFSDLSSENARNLFSEFVVQWNEHKLDRKYYKGISTGQRTSHNWNIKA